jgi:hypothetical protein
VFHTKAAGLHDYSQAGGRVARGPVVTFAATIRASLPHLLRPECHLIIIKLLQAEAVHKNSTNLLFVQVLGSLAAAGQPPITITSQRLPYT